MTEEGINRIANLFLNDIKCLSYTKDDVKIEKNILSSSVDGGKIEILFKISESENGTFDNFKLIGKDNTIYATKILNFQKENDTIIIDFPFLIVKGGLENDVQEN